MTHQIAHNSSREMLIPYAAITENINIQVGDIVTTSSFEEMEIVKIDHIHALSRQAAVKIMELYKIDTFKYLNVWYERCPTFSSLYLLNLILKPYVGTETISEGSDKKD